jgi:hypothetical protein
VADAIAFDFVCEELEECSSLDRLETRGTVRIALKQSGLEARSVSPVQMKVVLDRVPPGELSTRGISDAEAICAEIRRGLDRIDAGQSPDSPEAVFARLGSDAG